MITILVDECYAFDYLSILEVKKELIKTSDSFLSWKDCFNNIKFQLKEVFDDIIISKEYLDLFLANKNTFLLIEKIRYTNTESISARDVDTCNMRRYEAKLALQSKFFRKNTIVEIKT